MKKEEVLSRLKEIITERLDVEEDQIVPEATFVEDPFSSSIRYLGSSAFTVLGSLSLHQETT